MGQPAVSRNGLPAPGLPWLPGGMKVANKKSCLPAGGNA
jgi:hypothetical protein